MEAVTYTCKGSRYEVVPITDVADIEVDIVEVLDAIADVDVDEYKATMQVCIDQGLAFRVLVNGSKTGFVYAYMDEYKYIGASVWLPGDIVSTVVGLSRIFDQVDVHKMLVSPHTGGLGNFVSMATGQSIRAYHTADKPISILRDVVVKKGSRMFRYLGVENG